MAKKGLDRMSRRDMGDEMYHEYRKDYCAEYQRTKMCWALLPDGRHSSRPRKWCDRIEPEHGRGYWVFNQERYDRDMAMKHRVD